MFTFQDWMRTTEDGQLHEVLGGEHVVTPALNLDHQRISGAIYCQLREQIRDSGRGEVFYAPAGVKLSDEDVVEPDLFVVVAERAEILRRTHVEGAPDLVVEILSKGTARRDRGIKRRRYEAFGVREYWIVSPWDRAVEQFVRRAEGRYHLAGTFAEVIRVTVLADVSVDLTRVW